MKIGDGNVDVSKVLTMACIIAIVALAGATYNAHARLKAARLMIAANEQAEQRQRDELVCQSYFDWSDMVHEKSGGMELYCKDMGIKR